MRVWDKTTRFIHWVVALAITLNLFVLEEGNEPHRWSGYTAVAFVCLRLIWGFVGGEHARFRNFPLHPKELFRFLSATARWHPVAYPGHNPAASWVYLCIWLCVFGLGTTGWMMGLDVYWGEEWVEEIHVSFSQAMQVLVLLHLLGLGMDSLKHKRHTWLSMFTGKKS